MATLLWHASPWRAVPCTSIVKFAGSALHTSSSGIVDQLITYVRNDLQGRGPQAVDVLRSGIGMQADPAAGTGSARLLLALSEASAADGDWSGSAAHAAAAARAAAAVTATEVGAADARAGCCSKDDLALCSALLHARALLVQGHDAATRELPVLKAAAGADSSSAAGAIRAHALGLNLLVHHALGDREQVEAASAQLGSLLKLPGAAADISVGGDAPAARSDAGGGRLVGAAAGFNTGVFEALAFKAAGDACLARCAADEAEPLYRQAASAASAARSGGGAGGEGGDGGVTAGGDHAAGGAAGHAAGGVAASSVAAGPLAPAMAAEVEADALMGLAQAAMVRREWGAAEEPLSLALAAAEAAHGQAAAALAPVLCLLGHAYSRSARVMYAEGLFREACKLLHLEPDRPQWLADCTRHVHPRLAACVAWRYCQLLHALPNRGSEAQKWAGAARELWSTGSATSDIEGVLGQPVSFTGKGDHGTGAIISMTLRRLLPMWRQ